MEDWVNKEIQISFAPNSNLKSLMDMAERANDEGDFGYFSLVDTIDVICKNLYAEGVITQHDWNTVIWRYLDYN